MDSNEGECVRGVPLANASERDLGKNNLQGDSSDQTVVSAWVDILPGASAQGWGKVFAKQTLRHSVARRQGSVQYRGMSWKSRFRDSCLTLIPDSVMDVEYLCFQYGRI